MIICVYEKNVYGNIKIYVHDPKIEKIITKLTGKKTLNESDLEALEELGMEVQIQRIPRKADTAFMKGVVETVRTVMSTREEQIKNMLKDHEH